MAVSDYFTQARQLAEGFRRSVQQAPTANYDLAPYVVVRQAIPFMGTGPYLECGTETVVFAEADVFEGGILSLTHFHTGETMREYPPQTWLEAVCYGPDHHIRYALTPGRRA